MCVRERERERGQYPWYDSACYWVARCSSHCVCFVWCVWFGVSCKMTPKTPARAVSTRSASKALAEAKAKAKAEKEVGVDAAPDVDDGKDEKEEKDASVSEPMDDAGNVEVDMEEEEDAAAVGGEEEEEEEAAEAEEEEEDAAAVGGEEEEEEEAAEAEEEEEDAVAVDGEEEEEEEDVVDVEDDVEDVEDQDEDVAVVDGEEEVKDLVVAGAAFEKERHGSEDGYSMNSEEWWEYEASHDLFEMGKTLEEMRKKYGATFLMNRKAKAEFRKQEAAKKRTGAKEDVSVDDGDKKPAAKDLAGKPSAKKKAARKKSGAAAKKAASKNLAAAAKKAPASVKKPAATVKKAPASAKKTAATVKKAVEVSDTQVALKLVGQGAVKKAPASVKKPAATMKKAPASVKKPAPTVKKASAKKVSAKKFPEQEGSKKSLCESKGKRKVTVKMEKDAEPSAKKAHVHLKSPAKSPKIPKSPKSPKFKSKLDGVLQSGSPVAKDLMSKLSPKSCLSNSFGKGKVGGTLLGGDDKRMKVQIIGVLPTFVLAWVTTPGGVDAAYVQPVIEKLTADQGLCGSMSIVGIFSMNNGDHVTFKPQKAGSKYKFKCFLIAMKQKYLHKADARKTAVTPFVVWLNRFTSDAENYKYPVGAYLDQDFTRSDFIEPCDSRLLDPDVITVALATYSESSPEQIMSDDGAMSMLFGRPSRGRAVMCSLLGVTMESEESQEESEEADSDNDGSGEDDDNCSGEDDEDSSGYDDGDSSGDDDGDKAYVDEDEVNEEDHVLEDVESDDDCIEEE